MPKKFVGENSKAVVARARKAEALNEKLAAKQKAEEDAFWEDDNKQIKKKQQRKVNKRSISYMYRRFTLILPLTLRLSVQFTASWLTVKN